MPSLLGKIADHSDYQAHGRAASILSIVVATGVCLFVIFFRDWGFGLGWLLVVPALWFAASLLLAMPVTVLKFWLATKLGGNGGRAIGGLFELVSMPFQAFLVYKGLETLHWGIWAQA